MGLFIRDRRGKHQEDRQPTVSTAVYVALDSDRRRVWVGTDPSQYDGDGEVRVCATTYGPTKAEADRKAEAMVARIRAEIIVETEAHTPQDDAESADSTRQDDADYSRRENEDNADSERRTVADNAAYTRHDTDTESERGSNVDRAQERRLQPTVPAQRHPISNIYSNQRGGRPVKAVKLKIDPVMVDYYRNRDGLEQDLELILDKTGIGPAGLARALGVDRDTIHGWRAHGMPRTMDPLAFLQIVLWVLALRQKVPWQR